MLNHKIGYSSFFMNVPPPGKLAQKFLYLGGMSWLLWSCQSLPRSAEPVAPAASPSPPAIAKASPRKSPKPTSTKPKKSTNPQITISLFKLDNQCNKFVTEKSTVPKNRAVESAVARVIEEVKSADLDLVGYRVNVSAGTATIDFRLPADAKRPLSALSNCEQLALYGSLKRTLTENGALGIKTVRFTDRGRAISP